MENQPDVNSLPPSLQGKKVVLVNHCDTLGEASIATFRLMQALRREGVDARMVVFTRISNEENISMVGSRISRGVRYALERLQLFIYSGFSDKNIFSISTGRFAHNVHNHPWIKEADIVCINWVSQGLMNLKGIKTLHKMGKHIVWTMFDMWAFTGICHNSYECDYYKDQCGNCMYLKGGGHPDDLSHRIWEKKMKLYPEIPITFVAQTKWLELKARSSSLLRNKPVMTINSAIPVDWYYSSSEQYISTLITDLKPNRILIGATLLDGQGRGLEYTIDALNYFGNHGYPGRSRRRIGVNVIDGHPRTHEVDERRGGIDSHTRADNHEDISLTHNIDGRLNLRHSLLEEYDVGPQLASVGIAALGGGVKMVGIKLIHLIGRINSSHLHQLAVEMCHILRAGALVEVVNILSDYIHVEILLQIHDSSMPRIRLSL